MEYCGFLPGKIRIYMYGISYARSMISALDGSGENSKKITRKTLIRLPGGKSQPINFSKKHPSQNSSATNNIFNSM